MEGLQVSRSGPPDQAHFRTLSNLLVTLAVRHVLLRRFFGAAGRFCASEQRCGVLLNDQRAAARGAPPDRGTLCRTV